MSLRTLALAALCLAIVPAAAAAAPVGIQTHLGVTHADFTGDLNPSMKAVDRVGLSIGLHLPLALGFALEPGLAFAGRGGDLGEFDTYVDDGASRTWYGMKDWRFDADYVEVPVLARLSIGGGRLRPTFVGGVDLERKTGERFRAGGLPVPTRGNPSNLMRTYEWGATVGAGVEMDSRAGTLMLEGRYTRGMTSVMRDEAANGTVHNRDVQVLLGVRQDWPWHK